MKLPKTMYEPELSEFNLIIVINVFLPLGTYTIMFCLNISFAIQGFVALLTDVSVDRLCEFTPDRL